MLDFQRSTYGLSIVIGLSLILSLPRRLKFLQRFPKTSIVSYKANIKLFLGLILMIIQSTVVWKGWLSTKIYTQLALFQDYISLLSASGVLIISFYERSIIPPPWRILIFYFASSMVIDLVWIMKEHKGLNVDFISLRRGTLVLKGFWLISDLRIQDLIAKHVARDHSSAEEAASILSRVFFLWIGPMVKKGYKATLSIQDLPKIHSKLMSHGVRAKAIKEWRKRDPSDNWILPFTLLRCLRSDFLAPVAPRILLLIFRYLQPAFIGLVIEFVKSNSSKSGIVLVLYAGLLYLGMAVSAAAYQNRINRLQVMIRGALISLLHHQSLDISTGPENSEVLTLIGTDVDSMISTGEIIHEIWAQLLEVIIGTTMLASHVHWLAILPLVAILGCSRMSAYVAEHLQNRQKEWNVATQKRMATITSALTGMKSLKMMGIEDSVKQQISELRIQELRSSERLRWIHVAFNACANALGIFAPVLTLVLYSSSLNNNVLEADEIFTSVALLAMVTHPANMVMTLVPRAVAVMANFSRVQDYLTKSSIQDRRESNIDVSTYQMLSLNKVSIKPALFSKTILNNVHLDLKQGDLMICSGAVGSGKTSLALALLGEVYTIAGSISISSKQVAYCAQNPWLPSVTIQDAISGGTRTLDLEWYDTVVEACGLLPDLASLSHGDLTLIENNGMNLSGGQKHRIALARAVYSRHRILILDDPFSALDQNVTNQIVQNLFGQNGIFKQMSTTVFLITNLEQLFPIADQLVFTSDGRVRHQSPTVFKQLQYPPTSDSQQRYLHMKSLQVTNKSQGTSESYRINDAADDLSRKAGDMDLYRYYIIAIGHFNAFSIIFFTATYSFFLTFSQYVLKWATESSSEDLWFYMSLYTGVSGIAWISTNGTMWSTQIKAAIQSGAALHAQLLERILAAPLAYFTETDIGVTLNRFGQDINLVDKQLPPALANLSNQMFKLLAQVAIILKVQPMMTLTIPLCSICVYCIQRVYLQTSRQLRFLDLDSRSQVYINFLDLVNGATTIRAFGWRENFTTQSTSALDLSQQPFYLLLSLQCWLKMTLDCLIAVIATTLVSLTVLHKNTITGADIGLALNLIIVANSTLIRLVESWTSLETSLGAISRLKSVQEHVPREDQAFATITPDEQWPYSGSLRLDNLSVFYPQSSASTLEKISLVIERGQKMIIMGRTGSGKSTLMLSLLHILRPKEGSIRVDDIDLAFIPLSTVRQRAFVAVPQDGFNIPAASLRFNLDPGHMNSESSIIKALKQTRLWEKILSVAADKLQVKDAELQHILSSPMSMFPPFSAGELQLLAICRTLLRIWATPSTKPIIILDEASSSLDSTTESILCHILRYDLSSYTVVIIAHRVEGLIKAMRPGSDLIATLQEGRLKDVSTI